MLYVIFLMLSLNWLFISSDMELIAELVVCSSDTMIAEYDVSMKAESSRSNRNTILEDGLTGTSLAPAANVMTSADYMTLLFAVTVSRYTLSGLLFTHIRKAAPTLHWLTRKVSVPGQCYVRSYCVYRLRAERQNVWRVQGRIVFRV